MRVSAKKSLGQHFLHDEAVLDKIVALSDIKSSSAVLEVGGGMGDLSRKLAPLCKKLFVIEKDKDMLPFLRLSLNGFPNAEIIQGDALRLDFESLLKNEHSIQIAANLPYYLTTDLMERFFMLNLPVLSISVMVQKEAGDRLISAKSKGPLGLLAQLCMEFKGKIDVPAACFTPAPKVDSVFLHFVKRSEPLAEPSNIPALYKFFKMCFSKRRKTLANNLLSVSSKENTEALLASMGLRRDARAEALPLECFLKIAEELNITNL